MEQRIKRVDPPASDELMDKEAVAIDDIVRALVPLNGIERQRVVAYIASRYRLESVP